MSNKRAKLSKICTMTKTHDIIWLDEVDSTNTYVRNNIDRLDNLSVVASLSQTSGRGQGEHKWHSAPGENLLFSIVLKHPDIAASEQAAISMHTAESVRELLRHHNVDTWIKLPNDIWVADKKICGILIENDLQGNDRTRYSWQPHILDNNRNRP